MQTTKDLFPAEALEDTLTHWARHNILSIIGVIAIFILICLIFAGYSSIWMIFSFIVNLMMIPLLKKASLPNIIEDFYKSPNPMITAFSALTLISSVVFYIVKYSTDFKKIPVSKALPAISIALIGSILYSRAYLPNNKLVALINLISAILFEVFLLDGIVGFYKRVTLKSDINSQIGQPGNFISEIDKMLEKLKIIQSFGIALTPPTLKVIVDSIACLEEKRRN